MSAEIVGSGKPFTSCLPHCTVQDCSEPEEEMLFLLSYTFSEPTAYLGLLINANLLALSAQRHKSENVGIPTDM